MIEQHLKQGYQESLDNLQMEMDINRLVFQSIVVLKVKMILELQCKGVMQFHFPYKLQNIVVNPDRQILLFCLLN